MRKIFFLLVLALAARCHLNAQHYNYNKENGTLRITVEGASHFASLALHCIAQEFPNKDGHVQVDSVDLQNPSYYHPAFYGCYDWHSSVHGHWMLVRLLKEFPEMPEANELRAAIAKNLTAANIEQEARYFQQKSNKSFERTYGWAWLLKLAEELYTSHDIQHAEWYANVKPLADLIVQQYLDFLPKQTYPIRSGLHPNTAFGLSLALDYAVTTGNSELETMIKERAIAYFTNDTNCPASWEPSGSDFLSPCLMEAELMSKVLEKEAYNGWLASFLPQLKDGKPAQLLTPALISDRTDMQLVHLDGLNLSRSWCMAAIARKASDSKVKGMLNEAAALHLETTLPNIASGDYAGEHWLASFAVLALCR